VGGRWRCPDAVDARCEHNKDVENLDTIPGIGPAAAEIISAETGGDMVQFATAGHLASWIGVCPVMNESAGATKSARTCNSNSNSNLKRLLSTAAMSVTRNEDCYRSGR
jgi:transposase